MLRLVFSSLPRFLVLVAVLGVAAALAGAAAASCNPGRTPAAGNWQDEWNAGPDLGGGSTCYDGSRAYIQVKGPNVQYADDSVWTGIIDKSGRSNPALLGQIGYAVDPGPVVSTWEETEYYLNGAWHDPVVPLSESVSVGDDPEFRVTESASTMHYFIGNSNVANVTIGASYSGCDAVQSSEVHNKGDQAAGEPSNHESLTSASGLRDHSTEGWVTGNWSAPFVMPTGTDWLMHQVQGSDDVDFWDSCTT